MSTHSARYLPGLNSFPAWFLCQVEPAPATQRTNVIRWAIQKIHNQYSDPYFSSLIIDTHHRLYIYGSKAKQFNGWPKILCSGGALCLSGRGSRETSTSEKFGLSKGQWLKFRKKLSIRLNNRTTGSLWSQLLDGFCDPMAEVLVQGPAFSVL